MGVYNFQNILLRQKFTIMIMKKLGLAILTITMLSSCVATKKYKSLQEKYDKTADELSTARTLLAVCESDKKKCNSDVEYLRAQNDKLSKNVSDISTLTSQGAQNLEKSLESLREKDMQIKSLNDAVNRKDSMTIALVTSLKRAIGNMEDQDIQINVDKGVVFVSLSDKFLFKSGSYEINANAKNVLAKVAKIIESKPDMDVMVEGHTDSLQYSNGLLLDNWDLSCKRSTALVRMLQKDFKVNPARLTAAGRSYYVPLTTNDTPAGRSANRRTRIIILPKLDQFYNMIEQELNMKK